MSQKSKNFIDDVVNEFGEMACFALRLLAKVYRFVDFHTQLFIILLHDHSMLDCSACMLKSTTIMCLLQIKNFGLSGSRFSADCVAQHVKHCIISSLSVLTGSEL